MPDPEIDLDALRQAGEELRLKLAQEATPGPRDRMLQFFTYAHLPDALAEASAPFCKLAEQVATTFPMNPERTVCLRKLLEAKDAAVRTLLYQEPPKAAVRTLDQG